MEYAEKPEIEIQGSLTDTLCLLLFFLPYILGLPMFRKAWYDGGSRNLLLCWIRAKKRPSPVSNKLGQGLCSQSMHDFKSTFYSFGRDRNFKPDVWRKYFMNYDSNQWEEDSGGSLHLVDSALKYSLMIVHNRKYGLMLNHEIRNIKERKTIESYFSVGDKEKLSIIEDIGDEEFYPVGCFLKPENAWMGFEDFLIEPKNRSNRIKWVSSEIIEWLEW